MHIAVTATVWVRVNIHRFCLGCACRHRALPIVKISPSARNHADRAIELKELV
jgi:hypothetical protein